MFKLLDPKILIVCLYEDAVELCPALAEMQPVYRSLPGARRDTCPKETNLLAAD